MTHRSLAAGSGASFPGAGARDEILFKVRGALSRRNDQLSPPPAWSVPSCPPECPQPGMERLLREIDNLGGITRQVKTRSELRSALVELAIAQGIQRATLWETRELAELRIGETLQGLGIRLVSPHADKSQLAECDLGVTGVDCALPETGTLLLCSSAVRPLSVSLLPRVHLAILGASVLRRDLAQALAEVRGRRAVCITGPSRTADIEMTLAVGVHGPRVLAVWALGTDFTPG